MWGIESEELQAMLFMKINIFKMQLKKISWGNKYGVEIYLL